MFRALLAYPQEVLGKRHLVYCVRVMSVGCVRIMSGGGPQICAAHLHNTYSVHCLCVNVYYSHQVSTQLQLIIIKNQVPFVYHLLRMSK
jgi:hypothetical protein